MNHVFRSVLLASCAIAPAAILPVTSAYAQTANRNYSIAPQGMDGALRQFASQSGQDVVFEPSLVAGLKSKGLQGSYDAETALRAIIRGSKLEAYKTSSGFALRGNESAAVTDSDGKRLSSSGEEAASSDQAGISEILVVGSRSQNVDIRRSEGGPQPYVVFSAEEIGRSGAVNVEDFLRSRLPSNTARISPDEVQTGGLGQIDQGSFAGGINLRGLGSNQTLVLVDGRRLPSVGTFGDLRQGNLRGIPLAAIDRIEVLPSTAGAIYGGSAVGGVVNVILKRSYRGLDVRASYGNTFDGVAGNYRIEATGGFSFGPVSVAVNAGHSKQDNLSVYDRSDLVVRGRELAFRNNPSLFSSPPSGYTPNICAATSLNNALLGRIGFCNGQTLVLDDGRSLNSTIASVPVGYRGPVAAGDGGAAFLETAGEYNLNPPKTSVTLLAGNKYNYIDGNIKLNLSNNIDIFATGAYNGSTSHPYTPGFGSGGALLAGDPNNPFQQDILIIYTLPDAYLIRQTYKNSNLQFTSGATIRFPRNWSAGLEYDWSRSRSSADKGTSKLRLGFYNASSPFGTRDTNIDPADLTALENPLDFGFFGPVDTTLGTASIRASGPVFKLPGGDATVTALAEHRREEIGELLTGTTNVLGSASYNLQPKRHQTVFSQYVEARLPVFAGGKAAFPYAWEVQGSIRRDVYSQLGSTSSFTMTSPDGSHPDPIYQRNNLKSIDYLIATRLEPLKGVALRASYSTGFAPPTLLQLSPNSNFANASSLFGVTDPRRGNTALTGNLAGQVFLTSGGNPNLDPEQSKSLSAGVVLEPDFLPGARFSVDFTRIRKTDEIVPLSNQTMINLEDAFPDRIVRGPTLPGDPPGYAGPIIAIDASLLNVNSSSVKSLDFQLDYDFDVMKAGHVHLYAIASRALDFRRQVVVSGDAINSVGFADGPLEWKANGGLDWTYGSLTVNWNAQYYDSYRVYFGTDSQFFIDARVLAQGDKYIHHQIYHDLAVKYAFDSKRGVIQGLQISGSVQNLFDKRPPVLATTGLYGTFSSLGDPRGRRFNLSISKAF